MTNQETLALEQQRVEDGQLISRPPTIEDLMAKAIDTGNVEVMKETFQMWMTLKKETAREAYNRDLKSFQEECPAIRKEKAVKNKDKTSVRYKYAPLEHVIKIAGPFLSKYGFSWDFDSDPTEHGNKVSCTLKHQQGHEETRRATAPPDPMALTIMMMNVDQQHGAAESYAKRRAFLNVTGLVPEGEDTDGVTPPTKISEAQVQVLHKKYDRLVEFRQKKLLEVYGIERLEDLPAGSFQKLCAQIDGALRQQEKQNTDAGSMISMEQEATLTTLIDEVGGSCKADLLKANGIKKLTELPANQYQGVLASLEAQRRK